VNWLQANPTVIAPGLPNGQVTFQVNHAPTAMWVGSQGGNDYYQDYYVVTALAKTLQQYDQNSPDHNRVLQRLRVTQHDAQLAHGYDYRIVVNFHLYEGLPFQG